MENRRTRSNDPRTKLGSVRVSLISFSFLLVSHVFISSLAYGRFYHLDADEIDREDRLSSEYYNDIYSYQNPASWDLIFQQSQLAYRAWAGSLDINRSYLQEDIKLLTSKEAQPIVLQFHQHREEGLLEQDFSQELRLQFNSPWGFYIAPLADAGTFKKWDDLGAAFGFQLDSTRFIELYVWSVDHYYNTKEDHVGDHYNAPIYTFGGVIDWTLFRSSRLTASAFRDTPLQWERPSRSYVYENSRTVFDIGLQSPRWETYQLWLKTYQEIKNEAKEWPTLKAKKSMARRVSAYSIGVQREKDRDTTQVYVTLFQRKADYENSNLKVPATEPATNSIVRKEWMLAATYNLPFLSNFFQWGLFYNRVRRQSTALELENEVKIQTAFELRISKNGYAFFNATWDIDKIVETGTNPLRPWGGGSLNFMIAF